MIHDDYEADDLRAQSRWERHQHAQRSAHPDCRDPDHPGCERCEPEDESTANESE